MDTDNLLPWRPPFLREMELGLRGFSGETKYLQDAETALSLIKTARTSFEDYSLSKDALEEPWQLLCQACDLMITAVQATNLGCTLLNRNRAASTNMPQPITLHESFAIEFFIPALQHIFFKPSPPQAPRLLALTRFLTFEKWGTCTRALILKALADILIKGENELSVDLGVIICIYEALSPGHHNNVVSVESAEQSGANIRAAQEIAAMAARSGILQGLIKFMGSLDCDNARVKTGILATSIIFPFAISGNLPEIAPDCIPALVEALKTASPRFWKGIMHVFSENQVVLFIGLCTLGHEVRAAAKQAGVIQKFEAYMRRTRHQIGGGPVWDLLREAALVLSAQECSGITETAITILAHNSFLVKVNFAALMAIKTQNVDHLYDTIFELRSEEFQAVPQSLFWPVTPPVPAPAAALPRVCQHCGKTAESDKKLKLCAGCSKVRYCSVKCQQDDWGRHKNECKKVQQDQTRAP